MLSSPHENQHPRHRRSAQMKHLEDRLEDIAQVLSSQRVPKSSLTVEPESLGLQYATEGDQHDIDPDDAPSPLSKSTTAIHVFPDAVSSHRPALEQTHEADLEDHGFINDNIVVLLDRYQRLMAPVIMTVASFHNTEKQLAMVKGLMREVSERMLIDSEKSMDLLQGLLVLFTWYNPHFFPPQNHTLIHLAMSLTIDLNIDRDPEKCEKAAMSAAQKAHGVPQPAKVIANDECRALIGIYYLTSMVFTSFRKVDTLNWTPWLSECLQRLTDAHEYESDRVIEQLVQIQRIMHEVMSAEYDHAPVQFFAKSFLSDLDAVYDPPGQGPIFTALRLHRACTRVAIWERSFACLTDNRASEKDIRQRLDGMWRCVEAAKAYIDLYLEMPVEEYPLVPFGIFAQFAFVYVVIIRASFVEMAGWDVHALRQTIDFSTVMEEASCRYDAVSGSCVDGDILINESFAKWSAKTSWFKAFYDTKFASGTKSSAPIVQQVSRDPASVNMNFIPARQSDVGSQLPVSQEVRLSQFSNPFTPFDDYLWTDFDASLQSSNTGNFQA